MRNFRTTFFFPLLIIAQISYSQNNDSIIISSIVKEATDNSQLQILGHELLDGIGPRLVGTPQMQKAADWAIAKYKSWDIPAHTEKWGEWRGWERGITHIDLISQRVRT